MKKLILAAIALASLAAMMVFGSGLSVMADEEDDLNLLPAGSR
jgi:hypothetical protein